MKRSQLLDLYFVEARSKLIEVAAFLDRVERVDGEDDYRMRAYREALRVLVEKRPEAGRAAQALMAFSDPTEQPVDKADGKAATGAWKGGETNAAGEA